MMMLWLTGDRKESIMDCLICVDLGFMNAMLESSTMPKRAVVDEGGSLGTPGIKSRTEPECSVLKDVANPEFTKDPEATMPESSTGVVCHRGTEEVAPDPSTEATCWPDIISRSSVCHRSRDGESTWGAEAAC
jgi:hypothetical protein